MSRQPPSYTLLPSEPSLQEKRPLDLVDERASSSSASSSSPPTHLARFRRAVSLLIGVLSIIVLAASVFGVQMAMGHGCQWSFSASAPTRLAKRDAVVPSPTYSTTTYTDGATSTFVYTTRPILNPDGYTIGQMTGYVVKTSTGSSASSSISETPSATAESSIEPSAAAPSPTYSTTTYSDGSATSTFVYTIRPIVNPGGYTFGTLTGYIPISASSSTASPSATSSPTPASPPLAERDFAEVDMHLLHRRGVNFEDPQKSTGLTELSLSTQADGQTVTYVKTTRAIVNPGGFTIGRLDGAYVKLPKSTQPVRDELRRRTVALE